MQPIRDCRRFYACDAHTRTRCYFFSSDRGVRQRSPTPVPRSPRYARPPEPRALVPTRPHQRHESSRQRISESGDHEPREVIREVHHMYRHREIAGSRRRTNSPRPRNPDNIKQFNRNHLHHHHHHPHHHDSGRENHTSRYIGVRCFAQSCFKESESYSRRDPVIIPLEYSIEAL